MLLEIEDSDGRWGLSFRGLRPARRRGLELGNGPSRCPEELGLQLTAAAQGECGNLSPVHYHLWEFWLKPYKLS